MEQNHAVTDDPGVTVPPLDVAENLDALLDAVATANRGALRTLDEIRAVKYLTMYAIVLLGVVIYQGRA